MTKVLKYSCLAGTRTPVMTKDYESLDTQKQEKIEREI